MDDMQMEWMRIKHTLSHNVMCAQGQSVRGKHRVRCICLHLFHVQVLDSSCRCWVASSGRLCLNGSIFVFEITYHRRNISRKNCFNALLPEVTWRIITHMYPFLKVGFLKRVANWNPKWFPLEDPTRHKETRSQKCTIVNKRIDLGSTRVYATCHHITCRIAGNTWESLSTTFVPSCVWKNDVKASVNNTWQSSHSAACC